MILAANSCVKDRINDLDSTKRRLQQMEIDLNAHNDNHQTSRRLHNMKAQLGFPISSAHGPATVPPSIKHTIKKRGF